MASYQYIYTMKGLAAGVGVTRSVELDLFSDTDTKGPFFVSVYDWETHIGNSPGLNLQLDRNYGQNGEKLHLSITPLRRGTYYPGSELVVIQAEKDGIIHIWPLFVVRS